jgi:hypothetical protein
LKKLFAFFIHDPAKTLYYSYDQLLTLPAVTVNTERDPSAVTSKDYFRKSVTNRQSLNPVSWMPPHPTFDGNTFNALEAYFKAMWAEEFGTGQRSGNSH